MLGNFLNKRDTSSEGEMSFLQHLEELRWHLVRATIVILSLAVFFFIQKEFIFDKVILAPKYADFWTYKALCKLSEFLNLGDMLCIKELPFNLINTDISGQFTMHMWISFVAGLVVGIPYLLWEIWRFVKPALRDKERNGAKGFVFYTSLLFLLGILFGYYVIVPLSINFLGSYQVSAEVLNMISIDSFISTVTNITLASGIVFELPIVIYLLTQMGIMSAAFMRKFRKHAVVVILIVAAIITPSPDITSQILVAMPLYILYELSIFVARYVENKKLKS